MPFLDRFKNLFRGGPTASVNPLPALIKHGVNPLDHWEVIGELGDGAFGKVEKVVNRENRSLFAAAKGIEVQEGEELEDFLVEIEILSECKHENIVGLYACYFFEGKLSMMLEFCGGGAVDAIMIELEKALNEAQIAYVGRFVCEALRFLHSKNVIHRDLKAGNVLLTMDAIVKLADFGVSAKMADRSDRRDTFIGTPYWMAPEVMICETFKDRPYDTRADIWSFGITLIEMAQMEPPNSQVSPMRVLIKVQKSEPPTLEQPQRWSPYFNDFLKRCLVKNPSERCTADDLSTHPFLTQSTSSKPLEQLLLEMTAEVKEEELLIEDDGKSVDESVADTDDQEDDIISSNGRLPTPPPQPEHLAPAPPDTLSAEEKKKRLAPPPPLLTMEQLEVSTGRQIQLENSTGRQMQLENSTGRQIQLEVSTGRQIQLEVSTGRQVQLENSTGRQILVSPSGQEAIQILNDLDDELDARSASHNGSHERHVSPTTSTTVVTSRKSESVDRVVNQLVDSVVQQQYEPVVQQQYEPVRLRVNVSMDETFPGGEHEDDMSGGVRDLRERFERPLSTSSGEGTGAFNRPSLQRRSFDEHRISTVVDDIPSGLVRKNREIAQQQQMMTHSQEEAERIRAARRAEDAAMFAQQHSPVSHLAAHFVVRAPIEPETTLVRVRSPNTRPKSEAGPSNVETVSLSPQAAQKRQRVSVPIVSSVENNTIINPDKLAIVNETKEGHSNGLRSSSPRLADGLRSSSPRLTDALSDSTFPSSVPESSVEMPPPEPPPDYEDAHRLKKSKGSARSLENVEMPSIGGLNDSATPRKPLSVQNSQEVANMKLGIRKSPHRQTVTKKTRTYVMDGVEVTSTTHHVLGVKQDFQLRKQELQDLKRMQREEARQHQELSSKTEALREQQEKRFSIEKQALLKTFDIDLEALARTQKRQIEDAERLQDDELKAAAKRLRSDQEKDLRTFRDRLKQEVKMMKQEVDMQPKAYRKESLRMRKDQLEAEHIAREAEFIEEQQRRHEATLARMATAHKSKMALLERQFLQQKHELQRARESAEWESEQRQLGERHELFRQQLKDVFFLQRSHMLGRHHKELEHVRRVNQANEDELIRGLAADKKKLPKVLRAETKTRSVMFKESLRISMQGMPLENNAELAERLRRFDEAEKQRVRHAMGEHELKSRRRLQLLRDKNAASVKELEEIQNEKRKMLLENEQSKLSQYEQEYAQVVEDWNAKLVPRKKNLEARFAEEVQDQDKFYGLNHSLSNNEMHNNGYR